MSLQHGKSKRRILPRWRSSNKASSSADFAALRPATKQTFFVSSDLQLASIDFKSNPSLGTAAEAAAPHPASLGGKKEHASEAIQFILAHENEAPSTLIRLARSVANAGKVLIPEVATEVEQVRNTKRRLKLHPHNPMLWSDLARHFASHGDRQRANRCMKVALQLAPNHRWMLRSSLPFFGGTKTIQWLPTNFLPTIHVLATTHGS